MGTDGRACDFLVQEFKEWSFILFYDRGPPMQDQICQVSSHCLTSCSIFIKKRSMFTNLMLASDIWIFNLKPTLESKISMQANFPWPKLAKPLSQNDPVAGC